MLSSEVRKPPREIKIARTTSIKMVAFTTLLSNVSIRRIDAFSSRDSKAAITSISEKATRPIVLPIATLP